MESRRKRIITIAGRPGSGKSTAANGVAERLGMSHFSSGDLFRQVAKEQGVDVLQANLAAEEAKEQVPKIDYLVDQKLRDIGSTEDNIVIDSRMAWHWIPLSYKVFLDLDLETAASRILGEMTKERIEAEHIPGNAVDYAKVLSKRLDSEARRYKKLYDANPYETTNYDLVINTASHDQGQVIDLIIRDAQNYFS